MSEEEQRETGQEVALRRFPVERQTIERLLIRDDDFREMCEELAEAEWALRTAEKLPPDLRELRTAEWTASIEILLRDMARAIRAANIVRTSRAGDLESHK